MSSTSVQNPLPATFLRGGTSKGIFLNEWVLPSDRAEWNSIFLGIMGSPDTEYGRQLDGMGGGVSSLSKIMVVASPTETQKAQGIDAQYTFAQVGIRDTAIDYSGNCGNLTSMIGVFAIDEGICKPPRQNESGQATIRLWNTNTKKIIDTTFPVSEKGMAVLDLPQVTMAGVSGKASKIVLDFVNPGGARTGKLLPSGNLIDILDITPMNRQVKASLVDATNPSVFVEYNELDGFLPMEDYVSGKNVEEVSRVLEIIRQQGAIAMGLDPTAQAQPKIAILSEPKTKDDETQKVDIVVHALSMGVLHKAIPMTVGLCLGVASKIKGTIAWNIVSSAAASKIETSVGSDLVRIRHPGGLVDVGADFGSDANAKSAKVVRTGRRLMKGFVWY